MKSQFVLQRSERAGGSWRATDAISFNHEGALYQSQSIQLVTKLASARHVASIWDVRQNFDRV